MLKLVNKYLEQVSRFVLSYFLDKLGFVRNYSYAYVYALITQTYTLTENWLRKYT